MTFTRKFYAKSLLSLVFVFLFSCSSDSGEAELPPDVTAPEVSFSIEGFPNSSPTTAVVVSNMININISASDSRGVSVVEAFIDEVKVGEDRSSPFQISIDVSGYISKRASTAKYIEYTLKITATDEAGNSADQTQLIYIDNELPVIADVSLQANSRINGETNEVSFSVTDNEILTNVLVTINDDLLEEFTQEGPYSININTLSLSDGINSITIEAFDEAGNKGVYMMDFIADNTGPEIDTGSLIESQIIDDLFTLSPVVTDEYSSIVSFAARLNEEVLLETDSDLIDPLEIDPENYPAGSIQFEFEASDDLGNTTTLAINAEVKRRLFVANFQNGFFESDWTGFWILISEMDGSFIELVSVEFGAQNAVVLAPGEFDLNKEYMVTFLTEENNGSWNQPHVTNVQNLTRTNFNEINFTPGFGENLDVSSIPLSGFLGVELIEGRGNGFQATQNAELTALSIDRSSGFGYGMPENLFIIGYYFGESPNDFGYYRLSNPWDPSLTIDRADFITNNTSSGNLDYSNNSYTNEDKNLYLYGFETTTDLEENNSNLIFDSQYTFGFSGSVDYFYPDVFEYYKTHFRLNNYNTFRTGLPPTQVTIPNWSIDLIQNGNEISVTKSGEGHIAGRIIMEIGGPNTGSIQMPVIFDSSREGIVYLPELPEDLSGFASYDIFANRTYSITNGDLTSFDTVTDYSDYLEKVIKPYREHTEVAPVMENILFQNGFIFNNWGFKYW